MAEAAALGMKGEADKPGEGAPGGYPSLSIRIWPPTQRTREAVVQSLIEKLTTHSVLSKRYGVLPEEDAASAARAIEEEAFSVASAAPDGAGTEDDGIEVLHIYSQEISRRVLALAKARAAPPTSAAAPRS